MTVKFLDKEKNFRIQSVSDDAEFYVQISDSNQYIIMATGAISDRELGICANQDVANACINAIYVHLSIGEKFLRLG